MTHRPSRIARYFRDLFGRGNVLSRRRNQSSSRQDFAEMLEIRALLSALGYAPDRIIVRFESETVSSESVRERLPGANLHDISGIGLYSMSLPTGTDPVAAVAALKNAPGVRYAELDWEIEREAIPNDPRFFEQWGHLNFGQSIQGVAGNLDNDIDSSNAWDTSSGSGTIVVAINDDGVDYTHPDLAANIWSNPGEIGGNGIDDDANGFIDDVRGWDFGMGDNNPAPDGTDFHGTHVAGIVGAVGNNGIGVAGVNWNVKLMPIKIFGPTTLTAFVSSAINGLKYAVDNGAFVSNHSYNHGSGGSIQAFSDMIDYAKARGHIFVSSAGNSGENNDVVDHFPSDYPQDNVVAVAATDNRDQLASFSNFGLTTVDLGAPGVSILSTVPGGYTYLDGTSMASPQVAGAIALLKGIAPSLTYQQILTAVYQGVDPVLGLSGKTVTGGRLNIDKAIDLLTPAGISISPSIVSETSGNNASTITIRRQAFPLTQDLVLDLKFDDVSEVRVPALSGGSTITLPAGQSQITIPVDALDDTLLDGTQTVTFSLSYNNGVIGQALLQVTDVETLSINVSPASIREDAGANAGTITVSRSNTDIAAPNSFAIVNSRLLEHNPSGVQVSNRVIPWPTGARPVGEIARDLVVMENGRIAVHNGTTTGYVSILNPANNTWQHIIVPGLSSNPTVSGSGGISSSGDYVFLSDMSTSNGDPFGVVRVDTITQSVTRFANTSDVQGLVPTNYRYRDIYSGLDRKFYALDAAGTTVGRYTSTTLALDEFFDLAKPVNAIAIAVDGSIWGAGGDGILYHFSATGAVIGQKTIGSVSLVDIDLNVAGQILMTSSAGRVYKTNTSLITPTSFAAGSSLAFVSAGRHQTLPAGDLLVQLTNSDLTEVSIPNSVVIPVGQQSVTLPLHAVDDKIFDGSQTVTLTAAAIGYSGIASDTIDVLDAESVGVNIIAGSISEAAGSGATQAQIYRTDIDGPFSYVGPRQVLANNTAQTILDNDKINSYITVPTQTSRLTDLNVSLSLTHSFLADLDIYLVSPRGTRIELVSDLVSNEPDMISTTFDNVAPSGILTAGSPFTGRFRPEGTLEDLNGENPSGVWTLEITDDNPTDFGTLKSWALNIETIGLAPITVNLTKTGDTDEISVQTTVDIPANQSSVFVPINAIDDTVLDGTRLSGVRATTTSSGFFSGSDNVNVLDSETLQFTVNKSTVPETAGAGALTGTLRRLNTDINASFTVSLTSSDSSEITVPATVTIPAGKSFVTFPITVVDDTSSDGTQTVTVRVVTSQYFVDKNQIISVTDVEPKLVLSSSSSSVAENAGTFTATVTRQQQTDLSQPVIVGLTVSSFTGLSSPIRVPATVTIPAGRIEQTFVATVLDDQLLDGTQAATILARATGATDGSIVLQVTDHETLSLSLSKTTVREDAGQVAARGTVTRSNLDYAFPVTVTLTSNDVSEIKVPTTIIIPSGQLSASFDIEAVNDPSLDGSQTVRISASALKYVGALSTITVDDHEPPVVTAPAATIVDPNPVVQWIAVPNATRYEVLLQNLSTGSEQRYQIPRTSTTFKVQKPVADSLGLGRYRVLVRAYDQLERPGFWSVARDFRVVTAPRIIGPSTTSSLVAGTFPEIVWTPVLDASGYELTVHNLTTGKMNVISQRNLPTSSYRAVEVLGTGTYRATVRAFLSVPVQGQAPVVDYGYFSTALDFTVLAAPSVLTPVSGGTFDRSPMLNWSRITGAATYDVMVRNAQTNAVVFRDQSVPGTSIRIPQDLQNANYEVMVRAQSGRFYSNWSAPRFFAVGASPEITSPLANEKAGAQPKFVWTSITGAERYQVRVFNRDTNAYVIQVSSVTGTSYTPTTKLPLGAYHVTVRAISLLGDITNWSTPVNFVGGAAPVISSPTNSSVTGRMPSIRWSAVFGATAYNVKIVNLASNVTVVATGNVTGTAFTPSTNLAVGKYRIWVRAVSAQGHLSNWSTAVDITVASNVVEEELTTFGTPVVAAVLPVHDAESVPSLAEVTVRKSSSSSKFVTAVVQHVAEEEKSAAEGLETESFTAATDHVMAAWDVSDWWNHAANLSKLSKEVI